MGASRGGDAKVALDAARRSDLLEPGRPVVVLLSGGRDSTCLLDIAVTVAGRAAVSALHVNYGLRAQARADERHCAELCAGLGVPLAVHRAQRTAPGNLQAWAREVRYRAGGELAAQRGALLAAGHTLSDQAETVLYRLAASPGRRALLGMRPREGALVRPLLEVTREQTAAHCRARGLSWREDETNDSDVYARARVRADLLPALRSLHPAAEANVARTIGLLRDEAEVLDSVVAAVLDGRDRLPVEELRALPPALGRLVARSLAEAAAGRLAPEAAARLPEILALDPGRPRTWLDLGQGLRAVLERGALSFSAPGSPPGAAA